ncbi:hypothetical protein [Paenibacillus terrae]|uniref:Uncharacterized protein n=1 Tax=Paenibacillus terrae TaxID=159743 RepID=A0A0D7WV05_9BACL|nr:hypothetical protein [Paenibacillus terrae]KJD42553.1 hypothetical protein QD47_27610 [Paenibacillus terrae]
MKRIYANLIGTWTDITDSGLIENTDPVTYYNEEWHRFFELNYVNIRFGDKNYRIHPAQLQVVFD